MKIIKKDDLDSFVDELIVNDPREVVGVKERGNKYVFDTLRSSEELRLDYDVTILPPKKYFLPQRETLLKFRSNDKIKAEPENDVIERIILGIHPYDLIAIQQMDRVFSEEPEDPNYLKKQESTVLIGVNMSKASERCFAGSMKTAFTDDGYDLMLTDLGGRYAVEIGTDKGKELLDKSGVTLEDASEDDRKLLEEIKNNLKFETKMNFEPGELPELMKANYGNDKFWEENAENCYSCGTCNLVCPTCYCFDVKDLMEVTLTEGSRIRQWDGCLLEHFAEVAGGENFREERAERYRHRYMRKGLYLHNKFEDIACVGCGRCSSQCVPDIADPAEIFNKLKEGEI